MVSTGVLQIPHPQMQNRLFVLLPMLDLNPDWLHPVFKKNVQELIAETSDKSECKVVQNFAAPAENIQWEKFKYIAFEGNIGVGKSTLVNKIAEDFNAKVVLERFADNPFLPKFYEDQNRYAFSLEMSFLAERYQQLTEDLGQFDLFKEFIASDYHIFKSLIFAKVTLSEDEYRLYKTLFDIIYKETPKPDLYVYLYQLTDQRLSNIKKRGREYEQEITTDYLEKINKGYLDFIKSQKEFNVLVIDLSGRDFVNNQQDYIYILDEIHRNGFNQ